MGKSISPKIPLLLLFFFSNVSLVLLLAKVCKPTRCSSTGYQYSELLFFSCLFSGQLKLHNGVLGARIIDYIPATFTNSDTPSTNNAFLLKATFILCTLWNRLIELSHWMMSKRLARGRKHHPAGKRTTYSPDKYTITILVCIIRRKKDLFEETKQKNKT